MRSDQRRPRWLRHIAVALSTAFLWSFTLAAPVTALTHQPVEPNLGVRNLSPDEMEKLVGKNGGGGHATTTSPAAGSTFPWEATVAGGVNSSTGDQDNELELRDRHKSDPLKFEGAPHYHMAAEVTGNKTRSTRVLSERRRLSELAAESSLHACLLGPFVLMTIAECAFWKSAGGILAIVIVAPVLAGILMLFREMIRKQTAARYADTSAAALRSDSEVSLGTLCDLLCLPTVARDYGLIRRKVIEVLPQMKREDFTALTEAQRGVLLDRVTGKYKREFINSELNAAVISAMPYLGDRRLVPMLRDVAAGRVYWLYGHEVQDAAQAALAIMEADSASTQSGLLRPSCAPRTDLLIPAADRSRPRQRDQLVSPAERPDGETTDTFTDG